MSFITIFTAGLAAMAPFAAAYTPPKGDPTGNAIYEPGKDSIVPVGKPFEITWNPTTEGKVALVLLHGPSTNVVPIATIADSIDNTGSYSWTPSTDIAPNTTYYGLQIIVEGTGQYQYSTQFGISNPNFKGKASSSDSTSSSVDSNIKLPLTSDVAGVLASASGLVSDGSSVVSSVVSEASGKISEATSKISDAAVSAGGVVSSAVASASAKVSSAASAASGSASSALASASGSMSTATKTATKSSSASGSSTGSASASLASSTGAAGKLGAGFGSLALAAGVAAFVF